MIRSSDFNSPNSSSSDFDKRIWPFPPNRSCGGNIAWWLGSFQEPLLIDCPEVSEETFRLIEKFSEGSKGKILLTSRKAHGQIRALQEAIGWPVVVQEQEAYLLPDLSLVETFAEEYLIFSDVRLLWTPGPSPGSCIAYVPNPSNVLFCGRLLVPVSPHQLAPLVDRTTFHRTRYGKSLKKLADWLPPNSSPRLASGALGARCSEAQLFDWNCWSQQFVKE